MKSGGPWNLRGLRPDAREAARDAARRSGMSVGEWLNSVIQPGDDGYDELIRVADDDAEDDGWRDDHRRNHRHEPRYESRRESRHESRHEPRYEPRDDYREPRRERGPHRDKGRRREGEREHQRQTARERERATATREREIALERESTLERESAFARQEFGEVHARLDRLTQQLDRMARREAPRLPGSPMQMAPGEAPRLTGAPPPLQRGVPPPAPRAHSMNRPAMNRPAADGRNVSIDDAIAEINERQRALYGEASTAAPAIAPAAAASEVTSLAAAPAVAPVADAPPSAPVMEAPPQVDIAAITAAQSAPVLDIAGLERQLREITTRIESLRPNSDIDRVIQAVRKDLAEIRQQLTEALPRHAVESLEIEVQALAQRINHSRESGVEPTALAGLERGLAEVRDALRGMTTAENLVGFDDAVKALAQKVDLIVAKEDPAALRQLETAIGALRGIVSHVASNDTLTKVAEDVRALAAKVDSLALSAASGHAVSQLENRIETLASALNASAEAGHAVPRELEKLLSGLIEKLEWVQLTHTEHAALGHLEDRIAQLIKRFDASEARFGNLEAVERGLADLLVHLDKVRGGDAAAATLESGLKEPESIEREVAEIKRSERRTLDSLEAVHGAVEHVVDRLAMIESTIHRDAAPRAAPAPASAPAPTDDVKAADIMPAEPAATPPPPAEPPARRPSPPRPPIDPNLPPDHPLEPGSAAGPRATPSAADRIAASEAAFGAPKPPVIAEPNDKPNFIAAARRAAQTAAAFSYDRKPKAEPAGLPVPPAGKVSGLRKLIVAGGAVLIAIGCVQIASHMVGGPIGKARPQSEQIPPTVLSEPDQSKVAPLHPGPLVLPVPGAARGPAPDAVPSEPPPAAPQAPTQAPTTVTPAPAAPARPGRQSALPNPAAQSAAATGTPADTSKPAASAASQWTVPDITGSLSRLAPQSGAPNAALPDKLPATIGGPALRVAAMAGDAAAEFEVAVRFGDGRGVPASNEEAAHWLERAAKQGLTPAQFRLGGLYEKGIGVKKDLAAARDLYRAAAEKGNGKAMHNLAVLYAEGVNGPADYRSAAHWFRLAADRGVADSQYNLAILYARGAGVEQNFAESYKWFLLAANQGDSDAAKKRDEVASHLDQQALAAAQLAAQKWAAEPQPEDAVNVKAPAGGWDAPAGAARAAKPKAQPAATARIPAPVSQAN